MQALALHLLLCLLLDLGHQQVAQHSWWVCGVFLLPYFQWSEQHLWVVELARGVMLRQGLALPAHQTAEACWMLTLVVADCKPADLTKVAFAAEVVALQAMQSFLA